MAVLGISVLLGIHSSSCGGTVVDSVYDPDQKTLLRGQHLNKLLYYQTLWVGPIGTYHEDDIQQTIEPS